jgi:hypothetical protein
MNFPNLYLERSVTDEEIRRAVACVFAVGQDDVSMYSAYEELARDVDPTARVQVERLPIGGEFPIRVGISVSSDLAEETADGATLLAQLCEALGSRGVIADESSDNPYAFTLLTPDGAALPIDVDAERVDHGEIVRSHVAASHD